MGRWQHYKHWVWLFGEWLEQTQCSTCGQVFDMSKRWKGQ